MCGLTLHALTWNLYHGRDHPPDPALLTWRSRLWRRSEHNETHVQVNRDLLPEYGRLLATAGWDAALLQECPPRWARPLAQATGAAAHRVLTSRNSLAALRGAVARLNPDLIASNEGGSNLTLVRGDILERRELVLEPGPQPERRVMAFTRARPLAFGSEVCIANLHASAGPALRELAEREVLLAARTAVGWADGSPLVLGGDLNLRPAQSPVFERLADEFGLAAPTAPDSLDHLLVAGLERTKPATAWPPERREVATAAGAIRLSDHAPVTAAFG
jgi:endonuclease/exonuclease/phosphatase family metal-dependent hydrolase